MDPLDDAHQGVVVVLERSRALGFLGPGAIEGHVAHALAFAEHVPTPPRRALDLGSGGGLPGLVLAALVWPDAHWRLLDGSTRRAEFLRDAVAELGLTARVAVDDRRAELAGHDPDLRGGFDLVVARSFARPGVTAECAAPLLRVGGTLVVSEPPGAAADRWPAEGLAMLGLNPATRHVGPPGFAVMRQDSLSAVRYPRRVGIPGKRPLF